MVEAINDFVFKKKLPFRYMHRMQLMANKSFERLETSGLGYFDSEVKKIPYKTLAIRFHIRWNNIKLVNNSYKNRLVQCLKEIFILYIVMK